MARPVSYGSSVGRLTWPFLSLGQVVSYPNVSPVGKLEASRIFTVFDLSKQCSGSFPFLISVERTDIFGILKVTENFSTDPDPHPDPDPFTDPLVRDSDLRTRICIQIRTKMSWICNTVFFHFSQTKIFECGTTQGS
jgi:hypothetical protein